MRFSKTVAGLAAVAVVAIAGPAFAGAPYTVSVNGDTNGADHAYTASSSTAVTLTVPNSGGPLTITCTSVQIAGDLHTGTTGVNPYATVTSSTWSGCGTATVTPNHSPAWDLFGTGAATSGTTDNIAGYVGGFNARVSVLGGNCTFTVSGSADDTFDEATQTLAINESSGHLAASGASFGCLGHVANGDHVDLIGDVPLTSGGPLYLS